MKIQLLVSSLIKNFLFWNQLIFFLFWFIDQDMLATFMANHKLELNDIPDNLMIKVRIRDSPFFFLIKFF